MTTATPSARAVLHLTILDGAAIRSLSVTEAVTRIGRESANDVVIREAHVSGHHAEIRMVAGRPCLMDLRSTNGTRLRRRRWLMSVDHRCGHSAWLEDGDEILLGNPAHPVTLRVTVLDGEGATVAADPARIVDTMSCAAVPDVAERFDRSSMSAVQALAMKLRPRDEPEILLEAFVAGLLELFPRATHASVHLLDDATGAYVPALTLGRKGREPSLPLSRTLRDRVLGQGEAVVFEGNESTSLQESSIQAGVLAPIFTGDRVPGLVQLERRALPDGGFSRRELGLLALLAHQAALALEVSLMHAELRNTVERAIGGVVAVMEARDQYMTGHSQAVAELSRRIATRLRLDAEDVARIARAAALHDLGRFAVPETILNKPGALTEEEFRVVKAQPEHAASLLERCRVLSDLVPIIRHVHENFDGTGYPNGLAGQDIPLGARIVAVADAFHTLVSHRAHRQPITEDAALRVMAKRAGERFDPRLVGVLETLIREADERWNDEVPTVVGWTLDTDGNPVARG